MLGCWMGKNCGGTLGGPLEQVYGQPEILDVWWYPKLQEGGIPNDDLELQLVWLKALEEVGPGLTAADLSRYWLNHIVYNFDEYGLNKTNLRLGLMPPVSGRFNNWFVDCMGCPIRSEIWACIAPGYPRIAARYAYEDAICDHAGGESVYGELFNTAVESAAFVVGDRDQLLNIGLSYVPEGSKTALAIRTAIAAHQAGVDWKEARNRVIAATPSHVAQYSPINMGFQIVGWLYGEDFGDALCKTVNCGYDTDCTGATVGSILGIILGAAKLPSKWTEPLGLPISTNESWGGLRALSTGINPVPADLNNLTDRVMLMAERVLTHHGLIQHGKTAPIAIADLYADPSIRDLWSRDPMTVTTPRRTGNVDVSYGTSPAVRPGELKSIRSTLNNPNAVPMHFECELIPPTGWGAIQRKNVEVAPGTSAALQWDVEPPSAGMINNSNRVLLRADAVGWPAEPAVPIVLIGSRRYLMAGPFPARAQSALEMLDAPLPPESASADLLRSDARPGPWREHHAEGNSVDFDPTMTGTLYLRCFLHSDTTRTIKFLGHSTCPFKVWVNGHPKREVRNPPLLRPAYHSGDDSIIPLNRGWNEVLVKYARQSDDPIAFATHLNLIGSTPMPHDAGLADVLWTRFPWD